MSLSALMVRNIKSYNNMAIKITREDYIKKFGVEPPVPSSRASFAKEETPEQPKSFLEKITGFAERYIPGAKFGEALGSSLFGIGQAIKERRPSALLEATQTTKPKEVIGDIAQSIALPASLAVGGVGGIARRAITGGGIGATIVGGSEAAKGGGPEQIRKSAMIGGITGGSLPLLGKGLRTIGDQIDNLPSRFVESALGRTKAQVLADSKRGGQSLARYVLDSKPIGTAETMLRNSDDAVSNIGDKIQSLLSSSVTKAGNLIRIGRDNFLDEISMLPEAKGALMRRADVRNVIEKLAPQSKELMQKSSWTLSEANQLRQLVDKTLGDRGFLSSQLSADKLILKKFANSLRESIKSRAPKNVRGLFSELSKEIQLRDALSAKIAQRAGNQVLSFGDFIGGGLGGVFAVFGANPFLAIPAGVATRRVIESVPFKVGAGKFFNTLTKFGPTLNNLSTAQQTAVLELLAAFATSGSDQQEGQSQ